MINQQFCDVFHADNNDIFRIRYSMISKIDDVESGRVSNHRNAELNSYCGISFQGINRSCAHNETKSKNAQ